MMVNTFQMMVAWRKVVVAALLDLLALVFVFFVPALSHHSGLPVYLIEPMRVMVILALLHSHRVNAWALAVILPAFSYFVSGHPLPVKMVIITLELLLNVGLFQLLRGRISPFFAMASAILVSKVFYYLVKYLVVSLGWLQMELFATPFTIQLITMLVFSGYAWLIFNPRIQKNKRR